MWGQDFNTEGHIRLKWWAVRYDSRGNLLQRIPTPASEGDQFLAFIRVHAGHRRWRYGPHVQRRPSHSRAPTYRGCKMQGDQELHEAQAGRPPDQSQ